MIKVNKIYIKIVVHLYDYSIIQNELLSQQETGQTGLPLLKRRRQHCPLGVAHWTGPEQEVSIMAAPPSPPEKIITTYLGELINSCLTEHSQPRPRYGKEVGGETSAGEARGQEESEAPADHGEVD